MTKLDLSFKWEGRIDSTSDTSSFRLHQVVQSTTTDKLPSKNTKHSYGLIGFCCDQGVERNKGRLGAKEGPNTIRSSMASLAYPSCLPRVFDLGNIHCVDEKLEEAQQALANAVHQCTKDGVKSIVLGGGHETSYGHFLGLEKSYPDKKIGIINLDAHFDLRPTSPSASSGTPFLQIAEHLKNQNKKFSYLCLGIQEASNTQSLFKTAERLGVDWMSAEQMRQVGPNPVMSFVREFCENVDGIYLTICLDGFAAAHAPGVSAPSPFGLEPAWAEWLLATLKEQSNIIGFDVVELNPRLDQDHRTANLAAQCVFKFIQAF
ncbi:formimidoylglutamase [bacterium]|nr:formimidoylglutamase [bacterium]